MQKKFVYLSNIICVTSINHFNIQDSYDIFAGYLIVGSQMVSMSENITTEW